MRSLALVLLALLVLPVQASAQLDLTWDNCALADASAGEPPPSFGRDFDCTTLQTYKLHGSFKTPVNHPTFFAMDVALDLVWVDDVGKRRDEPLQPFWHYETGGCNGSGIVLSASRSASGDANGGCRRHETPWGNKGEAPVFTAITAYVPDDAGQPGRGRLLVTVARRFEDPFPLQAGTNYYGFHLIWSTGGSAGCTGCTDKIAIVWDYAYLFGQDQTLVLRGSRMYVYPEYDRYASINGALLSAPVPVVKRTWGQIKSLYR